MNILITGKPAWFEKDSHNAISYYRAMPLKELQRTERTIRVFESNTGFMPELCGIDIVFVHTPTSQDAIYALTNAKSLGRKIWLDFDDLVFGDGIPKANLAWTFFSRKQNVEAMNIAIRLANVITVSTQVLKDKIIELWPFYPEHAIHVIHNALMDEQWNMRAKFRPFREPSTKEPARILWRGSVTHEGDLYKFRSGLKVAGNLSYLFYGHKPWVIDSEYDGPLSQYDYRTWEKNVPAYFEAMKGLEADYIIVPLEKNDFNRAKSNIAWLEGTLAGAACIATDTMPEFDRAPCSRFSTPKDLDRVLSAISKGEDLRTENYMNSRALIEREYLWSHTNRKRLEIINALAS